MIGSFFKEPTTEKGKDKEVERINNYMDSGGYLKGIENRTGLKHFIRRTPKFLYLMRMNGVTPCPEQIEKFNTFKELDAFMQGYCSCLRDLEFTYKIILDK